MTSPRGSSAGLAVPLRNGARWEPAGHDLHRLCAGAPSCLRRGRGGRHGARRRQRRLPRRSLHGHHGPVGLRQVDADAPARRPRPADLGQGDPRRRRPDRPQRRRADHPAPRPRRLHLPGLQPAAGPQRGGEHPPAAVDRRPGPRPRLGRPADRPRRPPRPPHPPAVGALRRPAAARGRRPRARLAPRGRLRRRADRQPRLASPRPRSSSCCAARSTSSARPSSWSPTTRRPRPTPTACSSSATASSSRTARRPAPARRGRGSARPMRKIALRGPARAQAAPRADGARRRARRHADRRHLHLHRHHHQVVRQHLRPDQQGHGRRDLPERRPLRRRGPAADPGPGPPAGQAGRRRRTPPRAPSSPQGGSFRKADGSKLKGQGFNAIAGAHDVQRFESFAPTDGHLPAHRRRGRDPQGHGRQQPLQGRRQAPDPGRRAPRRPTPSPASSRSPGPTRSAAA